MRQEVELKRQMQQKSGSAECISNGVCCHQQQLLGNALLCPVWSIGFTLGMRGEATYHLLKTTTGTWLGSIGYDRPTVD